MVFCKKNEVVRRSRWKDEWDLVLNQGGPGFCHFAITNLCDAHCEFCNFAVGKLKAGDIRSVSLAEGLSTIDILYRAGIRYIIFVGGEPLLHKNILEFIHHAHSRGMTPMICTNGGRLTPEMVRLLKDAGLKDLLISIDAPSAEVHEKNRNMRGLCEKIRQANAVLAELKIHTTASVTISRLVSDYGLLPDFLRSLGFSHVTFSYPLDILNSSYLGFARSPLVQYTPEELFQIFGTIKRLKKKFSVLNNTVSLTEMQRFVRKKRQMFPCLGGYRYFYVDWNLDVYRCHYWEHPMCKIQDFGPDKFVYDNCTRCMIDCYRDPSVLQHIAVSITEAYRLYRSGEYGPAITRLLTKKNFLALKAVMEQMRWISKL